MASTLITIPEKTWTILAANVTGGSILLPLNMGQYNFYATIRQAGDVAPTDPSTTDPLEIDSGKAQKLFYENPIENIISGSPIDIYIWTFNSDSDSGDYAKLMVVL